jgi:hypothetical protein
VIGPDEPRPKTFVPEHVAFEHAAAGLLEHVVFEPPPLIADAEPGVPWSGGILGSPLLLHDISGEPLYYSYPVMTSHGDMLGRLWIAANTRLGVVVGSILPGPRRWSPEGGKHRVLERAAREHPGWEVQETLPVVYSHPRVGFIVTLRDQASDKTARLIIDALDATLVPEADPAEYEEAEAERHGDFGWSVLAAIPAEEKVERIRQWGLQVERARSILEAMSHAGGSPEDLRSRPLGSIVDLAAVGHLIKEASGCEIYTAPVPLYCQTAIPYCSAAVGRMLAAYYGVYHSQAHVAGKMKITKYPYHAATVQEELAYYKLSKASGGLGKPGSFARTTKLDDWTKYRNHLKAGRPSNLRNWAHSRVLAGLKVCKSAQGIHVHLGLVEPLPPDTCPKRESCNTYKTPRCEGGRWDSLSYVKTSLKAHVIPKD